MAKDKYFKLGENATLFVDASTGLKIAGKKPVLVSQEQQASKLFIDAKRGGHITAADADDIEALNAEADEVDEEEEEEDESGLTADQKAEFEEFQALKVDEKRAKILDDYELNDEDEAAVKALKSHKDLNAKFLSLLVETED